MVWPWRHLCCDIWSTLGDERHGGEALSNNTNVYRMQGEVMINVVGYEDPMVLFLMEK